MDARVDHARRLVVAQASGVLTDQDVFGYQRDVWSRPEVALDRAPRERRGSRSPTRIR
jgi:hypothetical protein